MKARNFTLVFALLLLLSACQKDTSITKPVYFTTTTYQNLSPHDTLGKPENLLKDTVSNGLSTYIGGTLPERTDLRKSNPELLKSKSIADIAIKEPSDVYITFVGQGAGNADAIAYYTYPTNKQLKSPKDIENIVYVFPNAGYNTPLQTGDKVKIGRFNPGTSIGFVLLENGWDPVTKKVNKDAVHFCSNDVLNPEVDPNLKKHAVLIEYPAEKKVLIGFEDMNRTRNDCDHDFNDVVLYATVKP